MNRRWLVMLAFVGLALMSMGCAPDERKTAAANVTNQEAWAYATAQALESANNATKYQKDAQIREATSQSWINAVNTFFYWTGLALTVSTCVMLLSTSAGGSIVVVQISRAMGNKALVWSKFVSLPVDSRSLQTKVIIREMRDGHLLTYDPAVGKAVKMDGQNLLADPQMVAGSNTARILAAIAQFASTAKKRGVAEAIAGVANNYPRLEE